MSGGCWDLRKRWDNLVGKSEKEAVEALKRDGRKDKKHKRKLNKYFSFYNLGEQNIEAVDDDTPESSAEIKIGVVRVILDEHKNVKYPPLRQD